MPGYSHRDLRVCRAAHRRLALMGVSTFALVLGAVLFPWVPAAFLAFGGFATLGAAALRDADYFVDEDVLDIHRVRAGRVVDGALRAEVESTVALDRGDEPRPRASPHPRRRRGSRADTALPPWATTPRSG
jgi:hypothetical protein